MVMIMRRVCVDMKKQAGFTLVDMAMMLAVAGVMTASLLSTSTVKKDAKYLTVSTTHMQEIKEAVIQYYLKFGAVPCPASATTQPNTATFGKATDCAAAAVAGVTDPAVPAGYAATDAVRLGVVPTRTLALPDSYMFDEWGNRLTYAVIKKLAIDSSNFSSYSTAVTTGVIRINNVSGTQISSVDPTNFTVYAVISHGKDGKGSYSVSGVANTACDTTNVDKENCNGDYVFMDAPISDAAQGASYFYDLTQFVNKNDIVAAAETTTPDAVEMEYLTTGSDSTCGVTAAGNGYCWGINTHGELGDGSMANKTSPTAVTGGAVWAAIDAGDSMTCGIKKADSSVWCWGSGSLGNGAGWQSGTSTPAQVSASGVIWKKVTVGVEAACGIKSDLTLWCWGNDYLGVLGNGRTSGVESVPVQVSGGGTWIDISLGGNYACGIKSDNTLYCWGEGTSVPALLDSGGWEKVVVGDYSSEYHACAINTSGAAYCWKNGYHGKVGNGIDTNTDYSTPVLVTGGLTGSGYTWIDLAVSQNETCGVRSDGIVLCFGGGFNGELGQAACGTDQVVPTPIDGSYTFTSIDGGSHHFCGIRADKSAVCWGQNTSGQLGQGSTAVYTSTHVVPGGYTFGP